MNDFKKLKRFKPITAYLTIKKSPIHGLGLFATKNMKPLFFGLLLNRHVMRNHYTILTIFISILKSYNHPNNSSLCQ